MKVRRTLPQLARPLIGAWCFADLPHARLRSRGGTPIGPDDVAVTGGMDAAPHPHTGLQTVSWLFSCEIEHRDSLGSHALVRPGELNLMTGGYGISRSEVSTARTTVLHGVQLWVALPEQHRYAERDFQPYVPGPVRIAGAEVRVVLGSFAGDIALRLPRRPRPAGTSPSTTARASLAAVPGRFDASTRPSAIRGETFRTRRGRHG